MISRKYLISDLSFMKDGFLPSPLHALFFLNYHSKPGVDFTHILPRGTQRERWGKDRVMTCIVASLKKAVDFLIIFSPYLKSLSLGINITDGGKHSRK